MRSTKEIEKEIRAVADQGHKINELQNESGEGYDFTDEQKLKTLWAEHAEALKAEFAADWTAEVTVARRSAWNDLVKSGQIKTQLDINAAQKKLGFVMTDLKKAIILNNIK